MKKTVYALAALLLAISPTFATAQTTITQKKFSEFLAKGFPQASPCGTTEFILILQNGDLKALPCSPLVRGPDGATQNNIAVFDGIDGKKLKDGGRSLPSGNIVGTTDTQTLTGKTMDYNNNTFLNFPGVNWDDPVPTSCTGRPAGTLYNNSGTLSLCSGTGEALTADDGSSALTADDGTTPLTAL